MSMPKVGLYERETLITLITLISSRPARIFFLYAKVKGQKPGYLTLRPLQLNYMFLGPDRLRFSAIAFVSLRSEVRIYVT